MDKAVPAFSPIPMTVIGGFLGSGKTSLLNHILNNSQDKRIAVLVNDFGEINIDAKLVVSVEGETISLANGSICCVIREDLLTEVLTLVQKSPPPEHIIIETSGVAMPSPVAETFLTPAAQGFVDVQNMIAVLDADLFMGNEDDQEQYRFLAMEQIRVADLVVINKVDLAEPVRLESIRAQVKDVVPRARILETSFGEIPLDMIFDDRISEALAALGSESSTGEPVKDHHHEEMFTTWTYRSDEDWSFSALQLAVEHMPRDIFRAKGLVRLDLDSDDYGVLQVTGRRGWLKLTEPETGDSGPDISELVFIGKPDATTNEGIKDHFEWALQKSRAPDGEGHIVTDLRAFNVVFV